MPVGRRIFALHIGMKKRNFYRGTYKYSEFTFANVYSFYLKYARFYVFYIMRRVAVLWVSCLGYTATVYENVLCMDHVLYMHAVVTVLPCTLL